jgi:RNA polymerase sigma-70 factor (ECF subfamily)
VRELPQSESGDMPEAEAIRLAREGNAAAFERLYRLHSRRVFTLCLRMLENSAEAEDLTQETFLTVFRRIQTFRSESGFSTWLHRVTVNVVLMHIRKKTVAETSLEEITEGAEETRARRPELGGPDLYLNGTIDRLTLQRAIDQLPPGFKAQFMLYDVEGYEHREIADMRGCSTGTSKSQLHRSRLRLRELLQKDQNNGTPGKPHSANGFDFEAVSPGNPPPVRGNKIVPFKRKRDIPIGDLTSGIDNSTAHACAAAR